MMLLNCDVEKTLVSSLDCKRSNQSILKEISPEYSLEGQMLKLQYFGHLMRTADSLEKTLMLGNTEDKREGGNRGWMDRQYNWLNEHEFEKTLESPLDCKEIQPVHSKGNQS